MLKRDFKFFNVAKAVSFTSDFKRIQIGAVIVNKKEIISVGCNLKKSHPLQKKYNNFRFESSDTHRNYIHAEMNAIIHANGKDINGMSIYVYREDRHGKLASSRPCPACMASLINLGVKKFFYTTQNGFCEEIIMR